jgi:hypothetical protein
MYSISAKVADGGDKFIIKLEFNATHINICSQIESPIAKNVISEYLHRNKLGMNIEIELPFQVNPSIKVNHLNSASNDKDPAMMTFTLTEFVTELEEVKIGSSPIKPAMH